MPKHLAIGKNVVSGSASVQNAKTIQITYRDDEGNPMLFNVAPRLAITITSQDAVVPFKLGDVKAGNLK